MVWWQMHHHSHDFRVGVQAIVVHEHEALQENFVFSKPASASDVSLLDERGCTTRQREALIHKTGSFVIRLRLRVHAFLIRGGFRCQGKQIKLA